MFEFNHMISSCSFLDLGFSGPQFMWSNMRRGIAHIQERLDRALGNRQLLFRFPDCSVSHLPRSRSDHHPLLLQPTVASARSHSDRQFRLLTAWFSHPSFADLVQRFWCDRGRVPLMDIMQQFCTTLSTWNKHVFGNIFERKRRLRARLLGLQRTLYHQNSKQLRLLETSLRKDLDATLAQEESLWK